MKRQGLVLTCTLLLVMQLGGASQAAEPSLEGVYHELVVLGWRIQFHYVWTGKYPEALDKVLKGKPDGKNQMLQADDIVDPFSPLKLPYGYILSEDGKSFLLYSVGPDGVDERGRWVYPFWPSSHLWSELRDKGPNRTIRGDLVIDSKELAEHSLAVDRDDLPISSPLLFEYMGARDLAQVTTKWVEELENELKELNTPSTLESRRESYLETFHRFCSQHNIEVRALDSQGVDLALARAHAPIPKKTAGRYELLNELARACGLRMISVNADSAPGLPRRVVVGGGPGDEAAFVLLLEPYWWFGCHELGFPVSELLTDPADPKQLDRLKQVCKGIAWVRDHGLVGNAGWFSAVIIEVVGISEPVMSDENEDLPD